MDKLDKEKREAIRKMATELQEMAYSDIPIAIIFEQIDYRINEYNKKYNN